MIRSECTYLDLRGRVVVIVVAVVVAVVIIKIENWQLQWLMRIVSNSTCADFLPCLIDFISVPCCTYLCEGSCLVK